MTWAGIRIGVGTRVMYDGEVHVVTEWLPDRRRAPTSSFEARHQCAGCRWWSWSVVDARGC